MEKAGRTVGPSPMAYGPTLDFLKTVTVNGFPEGSSCGSSGDKYCSFISPEQAKRRNKAFVKDSAKNIDEMAENCKKEEQ